MRNPLKSQRVQRTLLAFACLVLGGVLGAYRATHRTARADVKDEPGKPMLRFEKLTPKELKRAEEIQRDQEAFQKKVQEQGAQFSAMWNALGGRFRERVGLPDEAPLQFRVDLKGAIFDVAKVDSQVQAAFRETPPAESNQ